MIASTPTFRCRSNIADIFFAFLAQMGANTKDRLHGPEILFVLRAAIFIHCVGFYQPWSIYSFLVEWAFHMTPNNQSQYKQINKIIHLSIKAAFSNAYEIVHYHDHYQLLPSINLGHTHRYGLEILSLALDMCCVYIWRPQKTNFRVIVQQQYISVGIQGGP